MLVIASSEERTPSYRESNHIAACKARDCFAPLRFARNDMTKKVLLQTNSPKNINVKKGDV